MTFAYHRSLGPLVGAILALSLIEAIVVHIVAMAYWGWKVALCLGLVDVAALGLLIRLLRSFRRAPISLDHGRVTMRTGSLWSLPIELDNIAGFRDHWTRADLKRPDVLNMALLAWPNVVLQLRRPVIRRRRSIIAVAHCVDAPDAFRSAVLGAIDRAAPGRDRRHGPAVPPR